MLEQSLEVGGERVVVVSDGWLAGGAEPAPVVADAAVARLQQHAFLAFPGVAVQRVPVDQHDGAAGPVVIEVDADVGAVLLSDGDVGHGFPLACSRFGCNTGCRASRWQRRAVVEPGTIPGRVPGARRPPTRAFAGA